MREPHVPGSLPPRDWSEAFAALPADSPSAGAMARVIERLPASAPARSRRQWWIAVAAVLALAAVVPFVRHSRESGNPAVASDNRAATPTTVQTRLQPETNSIAKPIAVVETQKLHSSLRGNDERKHSMPVRIAKATAPHRAKSHRDAPATQTNDPSERTMEPLYAESARLEALLALARDERVASATAVALGSDFESQLSAIDAALAQPSLDAKQREALWRERVSALRAYASFESTQRALAASGERYDAMLVSVD